MSVMKETSENFHIQPFKRLIRPENSFTVKEISRVACSIGVRSNNAE